MAKVVVIRHSMSTYPGDDLSPEGFEFARQQAPRFAGYGDNITTSEKQRAQRTVKALGYAVAVVDPRLNELELDDVNAATPHGYVLAAHAEHPKLVYATAQLVTEGLVAAAERAEGAAALVVSHNLAISALYRQLSGGEIVDSFTNLGGLVLDIEGSNVILQDRV